MLSLFFMILMIVFVVQMLVFALRAAWGILRILLTVVFFPLILVGMVFSGLIALALPLLILGAVVLFAGSILDLF